MAKKDENKQDMKIKIIESALALAASQGWEYTTLRDIAQHAELSMSELFAVIEDKDDILVAFGKLIDARVMEGVSLSDDDMTTPREKLFDILMDRYEVLNDYRDGLVSILDSFKCDPKQVIISMPYLCKSMGWMLEASGIETSGFKGALKVAGMTGVYLKVLRTWKEDDSADLAKTMAALDKTLERAEKAADTFGF